MFPKSETLLLLLVRISIDFPHPFSLFLEVEYNNIKYLLHTGTPTYRVHFLTSSTKDSLREPTHLATISLAIAFQRV